MFFICCSANFFAQTNNWLWAKSAVAETTGAAEGLSVSSDAAGNVFVTGLFTGSTLTFGSTILSNADLTGNTCDIFIAKYDANGNILWAKSAGGTSPDYSYSVNADAGGNVYITGEFKSSTITFGSTTLTNADPSGNTFDIFIAKYDANGNVLWAKSATGTSTDWSYSINSDTAGNLFITGFFFSSTITFGSTTLTNSGLQNIFIAKYDANGNVLWARSAGGGTNDDESLSISADAGGNVFITGYFTSSTITFGSTILNNTNNSSNGDVFIAKYDVNGNVLWARSAIGTLFDKGYSISSDTNGNVFLTGGFGSPTLTFGSISLTNANSGYDDIFIVKYDSVGNVLWAKSGGGTSHDEGYSISANAAGNIFVTGAFTSPTITFGSTILIPPIGSIDPMFIVKYDANGNLLCAAALASGGDDQNGVSADHFGNAYIGGDFLTNPFIVGSDTLTPIGGEDVFVAKYVCLCTPIVTVSGNITICKGDTTTLTANGASTYVWFPNSIHGDSISVSPLSTTTYSVVGTSLSGCSDTAIVIITVNPVPFVTLNLSQVDTQCVTINSVALNGGFPLGGTFSGIGVSGNNFHPSATGLGTFAITYTYTNLNGCSSYATGSIFVAACTGISPVGNELSGLEIYPSPANQFVTIQLKNLEEKNLEIKITNVYGQTVIEKEEENISKNFEKHIDVSGLNNGIYFISIQSGENIFTRKIIIQR